MRKRENKMSLPNDPVILLSYINTQLRDKYSSLDKLCDDFDIHPDEIINKLSAINYTYDETLNKFI